MVSNTRKTKREESKKHWTQKINDWKSSGLSGGKWCKQNGIKYSKFIYWKLQIGHSTPPNESFIEISNEANFSSGVEILLGDFTIRLAKDFDTDSLKRCLTLMGTGIC